MKKRALVALWVSVVGCGLYGAWHGDQSGVRACTVVVLAVVLWSRLKARASREPSSNDHI
jgi:hypothetical protein